MAFQMLDFFKRKETIFFHLLFMILRYEGFFLILKFSIVNKHSDKIILNQVIVSVLTLL